MIDIVEDRRIFILVAMASECFSFGAAISANIGTYRKKLRAYDHEFRIVARIGVLRGGTSRSIVRPAARSSAQQWPLALRCF